MADESIDIAEALHRGLNHVCGAMGGPVGHAMLVAGDRLTPTEIWFLEDPGGSSVVHEVTATVTFPFGQRHGPLRATAARHEPTCSSMSRPSPTSSAHAWLTTWVCAAP